jgi:hypothetical protein
VKHEKNVRSVRFLFHRAGDRLHALPEDFDFPGLYCLYYTSRHLGIKTDTTEILSQDLPFLQDRAHFLKAFPQDDQAVLVVVGAKTPEQATRALDYLDVQFSKEKQQIKSVYIPGGSDFFDRHGLLYLGLDELNELAGKLAEAQPRL